jgi:Uma2 family endonuclease
MSTVGTKLLTAEEFFLLPEPKDGSKQELVRGEVVVMPSPGFEHGEIQGNVYFQIKSFLQQSRIGRVVVESGTISERKPDTVRGPDVSYYSKEQLSLDKRVVGYHEQPPDICVEVLSPSNSKRELRAKIKEYFFVGVKMVWVVEPEDRSITILLAPDEGRTLYDNALIEGGDVLPGFSCKVADFFV